MSWFLILCSLYLIAEIIITIGTDNLKKTATIETGKILNETYITKNSDNV